MDKQKPMNYAPNMRLNLETHDRLENRATEIRKSTGKAVTWQDLVRRAIEKYLKGVPHD